MPYSGPKAAIASVLQKLGISPGERFDASDQDPEYTACRSSELDQYFKLYSSPETPADERAVLCCFLLEGLNELIGQGRPHPRQAQMLGFLMASQADHAEELAYWSDTSDPDETNWWPICRALRQARVGTAS